MIVAPHSSDRSVPPAGYDLAELIQLCTACARRLRTVLSGPLDQHRLSDAAFAVLWTCYHAPAGGLSQKQLALQTETSPAHVSGLVELLRQRELLEGDRSPTDRRVQQWRLAPRGRELVDAMLVDLQQWAKRLRDDWPPDRCRLAVELLQDLNRRASQLEIHDESPASTQRTGVER